MHPVLHIRPEPVPFGISMSEIHCSNESPVRSARAVHIRFNLISCLCSETLALCTILASETANFPVHFSKSIGLPCVYGPGLASSLSPPFFSPNLFPAPPTLPPRALPQGCRPAAGVVVHHFPRQHSQHRLRPSRAFSVECPTPFHVGHGDNNGPCATVDKR